MKKETGKKKGLLWLVIGLVALIVVAAVTVGAVLIIGGLGGGNDAPKGLALYWNLDRELYMAADALSSSREPGEDGQYTIRFAYNGGVVEQKTADKQLVNYIDTMDIMGLVFEGKGQLVDAVPAKEVATVIGEDFYVQGLGENVIHSNSSVVMNGMKVDIPITKNTRIYDVCVGAEVPGGVVSLDALGVMDKIHAYADETGEITHVFLSSHPRESKVYWRANQFTSGGKTTREPDENGVYTIPFYCEGEYVELKCKNVTEVSYIDKQSVYSCHFGLVFDEEGYIEEAILSYEAIRGSIRSERFDVTGIDGNTISTTKIIGSNAGTTDSFVLGEDCPIYDVSRAAKSEERAGKQVDSLQLGDRIVCFADAEGNPLFVYVGERVVEEAVWCYNITRKYDSTRKETTRTPDANGWYVFEVFAEGKVLKVKTRDKSVANEMDSVGAAVFGLTLNGDEVVEVYGVYSVFGYTHYGQGRYITGITGSIFSCIKSSDATSVDTGVLHPDCKIWDLSGVSEYGAETKLQIGDYIYAYQNPNLQIVQIWVMRRMVDLPVYHSVERMYNSTKKETTRKPDEDGWYVFEVACNGKLTTVKTKNKALASKMDSFSPAMALRVGSDGVVYEAYDGRLATGGYRRAHGYTVTSVRGNVVQTQYKQTNGSIATRTLTLAKDCQTYNVNTMYNDHFGERTTVKVGDTITAYTNIYDETAILWIRGREMEHLYWNSQKLYDDTNGVSVREPDADGYYVYNLARNGKAVTLKTKDKAIADKLDYYGGAFTLRVKDGIITAVGSPSYAKNTSGSSLLNYDVVSVSGNRVTLRYNIPGSTKTGETKTITLSSGCKIYEVGPDAANFAAAVKLKPGDRIRAYESDVDSTYTYVFIRFHDSRAGGADGYCQVCKKDVHWEPWVGGSFSTAGGHYYLAADFETPNLPCSTGRSSLPTCTVCLDLNGNSYNRTKGRAMYVYANATLNIMDCVGGGEVISYGSDKSTVGGVLGIAGGTVNLYSGTLRMSEEHADAVRGGVLYIGVNTKANAVGVFNMYGGRIADGEVLGRGGNVNIAGGILNMYDGIIENGNVIGGYSGEHGGGGNILTISDGVFNMYGGTVTGGSCHSFGGNICGGTGQVNIYGGTVSNGVARNEGGGNIYMMEALTVTGGTITGGVSQLKSGGNIYVRDYNEKSSLTVTGGTVTGGTSQVYGGNIYSEVGGSITNATVTGGRADRGGNIYGTKDWTVTGATITDGAAGETKGSGGNIYAAGGQWTLEGSTVSGGTSGARGGNIYASGAQITMNSGSITGGTSGTGNANGGGNICTISNAVFILNGGSVTDGVSANTGGNILSGSGGLQVNGGIISGGTAPTGGADVYVYGGATDVAITGGDIGILEIDDVKTLKLSGKPAFGTLQLAGGVLADISQLDKNAGIKLVAEGVFTEKLTDASAFIGAFLPVDAQYSVIVEEEALSMAAGIKEAHCAHCDQTVQWKLWNGVGADGHYYVKEDMALEETTEILEGATLILDLAGNKVTATDAAFYAKGDLAILDSVGGGELIGAGTGRGGVIRLSGGTFDLYSGTLRYADTAAGASHGGVLYLEASATANLRGGTITDGVSKDRGGNIYINGGATVNLSGTTVTKGSSGTGNSNGGGNIFVLGSSTLNITGGKVTEGTSVNTGGNILVGTGTLNMSGGEVTGGTAATTASGIYLYYSATNANITGGTVDVLTYTDAASFTVSGAPVIGLLEIADGKAFTLGDLTADADITVDATGVFTTANANAQSFLDAGLVKPADTEKTLVVEDNKLAISDIPVGATQAPCPHCGGANAYWYKWDSTCLNGHYYLDGDTTVATVEIPNGSALVLDLKGNKLDAASGRVFKALGDLAILDSVGGGVIQSVGTDNGAVIYASGGKLDLYSGTIRYAGQEVGPTHGGVLYLTGVTAELRGGTVEDGKVKDRGGNIYITGSSNVTISGTVVQNGYSNGASSYGGGNVTSVSNSTLTVTGGKIIGGKAVKNAGNLLAGSGSVTISGGEITGGEAPEGADVLSYMSKTSGTLTITGGKLGEVGIVDSSSGCTVSGSPVIQRLDVEKDLKITLGALTGEADIKAIADGVFTAAGAHAADAYNSGYIKTFDNHVISLVENALSISYAAESTCPHCQSAVIWTAWDGTSVNGHFYLAADMKLTEDYGIAVEAGNALVLDLAGNKLTGELVRAFEVKGGTLDILDTVGNGRIVTGGVKDTDGVGGLIRARSGSFTLWGGILELAREHNTAIKRGGVIYIDKTGEVTIKGGKVMNGVTTERGGNIYIAGSGGKLTVEGGEITGGTCGTGNANGGGNIAVLSNSFMEIKGGIISNGYSPKTAGNILTTGHLTISGGKIFGGTADGAGQNIYAPLSTSIVTVSGGEIESLTSESASSLTISGKPVIGLLEMVGGQTATLGAMEADASITVSATGAFTKANDNAATYFGCFKPAEGLELSLTENIMYATAK